MVRGLKLPIFGLLLAALASCSTPTPPPTTPAPSNTPLPPPPTAAIVTIDASNLQAPPTWTLAATERPAATSTRRPTSTPFASATASETPGAFTGQLGVLVNDNEIALALTRADLEAELDAERSNALFSSTVSSISKISFFNRSLRLEAVFNNYTTEGIRSELDFALRPSGRRPRADLTSYRTERGTLLTPTQLSAMREMLNNALDKTLTGQLEKTGILFENPQVLLISVEEARIVIKVRLSLLPTLTPGDTTPTDVPPEAPTDAPTETEAATEAPTATFNSAPATPIPPVSSPTQLPTVIPTLFPTATLAPT